MKNEEDRIKSELILKEEQLLENDIRNDGSSITELIEDKCIEISASGKQRIYKSGELFGNVDGELYIVSNSVRLINISDDCKLLLYIVEKVNKNKRLKSNRSSIWKKTDGKWKMIFHQGTDCSE